MTTSSHLASSALVYLFTSAATESVPSVEGLAIVAFGSLLPDIDAPTSSIGRPFFPISSWLNRTIGHRTVTHSLVSLAVLGLLIVGSGWCLAYFWAFDRRLIRLGWLLVLGFASHILVDTLNKTGVELFWPSRLRCVLFFNERYRASSAGKGDYWFMAGCLILNLAAYPLARDGFTLSVHQAFGDIYSVAMDFKQYGERNRIWVELEGVERLSNRKIQGRFEVLGTLDNGSVLIERDGTRQIVSRTEPCQLYPVKSSVVIGEPQILEVKTLDFTGRTLGDVPHFPDATRVLIHGYLTPAKMPEIGVRQDRYNPVSIRLDKLKLDHAEPIDLRGMEHVGIREGILVLKISRSVKAPSSATDTTSTPPDRIQYVEFHFNPKDQVFLAEGQSVHFGQVIALRDVSIATERLQNDSARDLETMQKKLEDLATEVFQAREDLERVRADVGIRQTEAIRLSDRPLFAKELLRARTTVDAAERQVQEQQHKLDRLEHEEQWVRNQIAARSSRLAEDLALVARHAEIRAGLDGQITRIQQDAKGDSVVYGVYYRSVASPPNTRRKPDFRGPGG